MPYKDSQKHRDYYREYMRRRRAGQAAQPKPASAADGAIAKLKARVRELEAELARRKAQERAAIKPAGPARSGREFFSEESRLRREIAGLKSDIAKLKMALQEEPDTAKLRKKVIEQRTEMALLRQALRRTAKERDEYRGRTEKRFREASHHATRKNYGIIVKALHSDRAKHTSAAELAEAERIIIALRPLFDEGR
jgi:hypothetical protein